MQAAMHCYMEHRMQEACVHPRGAKASLYRNRRARNQKKKKYIVSPMKGKLLLIKVISVNSYKNVMSPKQQ